MVADEGHGVKYIGRVGAEFGVKRAATLIS
jgi:hypothetical protein